MKPNTHPFVSTPKNGPCSSCGKRRSDPVHKYTEQPQSEICEDCGGYTAHNQPGGCTCKRGCAGKKPVRVCMFAPRGQSWFDDHDKATEVIRRDHPEATRVRRWQENGLQYEDYRDKAGCLIVQLEFSGPPVLSMGFTYGDTVCPVCGGLGDDNKTHEFNECENCAGTGKI